MQQTPIFAILGLLLSVAIIARALLGGVYHKQSVGGRATGRVLLIFGVVMFFVFLLRVIQWYRVR